MKYVLTLSQEEEKVQEKEFSKKLCRYTLTGLKPGKLFKVELSTMTGAILTRDSIVDYILTKPLPVDKLRASVEATGAFLEWSIDGVVDGETVVEVKTHDDNETVDEKVEEIFLPPTVTSYTLATLAPLTTVTVSVIVRCVLGFYISTSDLRHTTFTIPPHPPTNLRERSREASQLVVEWDPPVESTLVLLTECRRRSLLLLLPPSRSRSLLHQRGSTPSGSEDPSLLPSPPSIRCGSPSRSMMSVAHPLFTASASKYRLLLTHICVNLNSLEIAKNLQLTKKKKK